MRAPREPLAGRGRARCTMPPARDRGTPIPRRARSCCPLRAAHARVWSVPCAVGVSQLCGAGKKSSDLIARAETSEQAEEWAWTWFQCTHAASMGSSSS